MRCVVIAAMGERVAVEEGDSPVSSEGVFVAASRGYLARPPAAAFAALGQTAQQ